MDLLKTVAMVTVLLAGFTYSQDCSVFTTQEACCLAAEKENCTYCQASDGTTQACLNVTQAEEEGACVEKLCQTGTETPPSGNTTTHDDVTSPSNHSDPITLPTSLPSNHTSTPEDNGTTTSPPPPPPTTTTAPPPVTPDTTVTDVTTGTSSTPSGTTSPSQQNGTTPVAPAPPAPCEGQHFDAASFIGGMILCGGVIAIVFFGCKFYQSRSDRKYQQF